MGLHLRLGEDGGLAEQIYAQLQERISTDVLPAGTVLPSSAGAAGGRQTSPWISVTKWSVSK